MMSHGGAEGDVHSKKITKNVTLNVNVLILFQTCVTFSSRKHTQNNILWNVLTYVHNECLRFKITLESIGFLHIELVIFPTYSTGSEWHEGE